MMKSCQNKWIVFGITYMALIIIQIMGGWTYIRADMKLINDTKNNELNKIMNQTGVTLAANLKALQYNLRRTAGTVEITGYNITQSDYESFVQFDIYSRNRSVIFLWIPLIPINEKESHMNYMRQKWNINYTISKLNENSTMLIPSENDMIYYTPLNAIIPINENYMKIIGYDFNSNNQTKIFLDQIDEANGDVAISNKAIPFSKNVYGITISKASCKDIVCKKENVIGYNMALVNIIDFLELSLPGNVNENDVRIELNNQLKNGTMEKLFRDDIDNNYINNKYVMNYTYYDKLWKIDIYFSDEYVKRIERDINTTITILILSLLSINIVIAVVAWTIIILKQNKNAMETKYHIANQMLGYVNHEIRNPLNAIIGLNDLSLLELEELFDYYNIRDMKSAAILSNLDTSNKSCLLLRYIVNDILDVRKLEEDKLVFEYEEFMLSDLVKDVTKIISPKLREKPHIKYVVEYQECVVISDRNRLIQLCLNLLTNAIKYTHDGQISFVIEQTESHLLFKVIDTGVGISDDKKERIFRPFEQVQEQNNSRYGGVGLGLYLCKLIIMNINGEIGFESVQGKGSTFWFKVKKTEVNDNRRSTQINYVNNINV